MTTGINPLPPKICLVILPSSFSTFLGILVKRIWVISRQYPPVDNYLNSHQLSALKYIDIERRSTMESLLGVKGLRHQLNQLDFSEIHLQ